MGLFGARHHQPMETVPPPISQEPAGTTGVREGLQVASTGCVMLLAASEALAQEPALIFYLRTSVLNSGSVRVLDGRVLETNKWKGQCTTVW